MVKKLNSIQLFKNVSEEKISLTNQCSKALHMIKVKYSQPKLSEISADKKKHADLVTFTTEILNGKLHFFCSDDCRNCD